MMIKRTPTRAEGGITDEERAQMDEVAREWIDIALRTEPADPAEAQRSIVALYAAADLPEPVVVLAASPLSMVYAYFEIHALTGIVEADVATRRATHEATVDATHAATVAATRRAMDDATAEATFDATFEATFEATRRATVAATEAATRRATYDATAGATQKATFDATDNATLRATDAATREATFEATRRATVAATRRATFAATYDATVAATHAATVAATRRAMDDATLKATVVATRRATHAATFEAMDDATRRATHEATVDATQAATFGATAGATFDATAEATFDATFDATSPVSDALKDWWRVYQGGNMGAPWCAYLSASRDVLGLRLPQHVKYKAWEDAARAGGFRMMGERLCVVSDFPEFIKMDEANQPHCENGPSHRWRDGWEIYSWHGVQVPKEWIAGDGPTINDALHHENTENRRAACEILGWDNILDELNARVIDAHPDPEIGTLVEVQIPDIGAERFIRVNCGTGRKFALPVPPDTATAMAGQIWVNQWDGADDAPEVRT